MSRHRDEAPVVAPAHTVDEAAEGQVVDHQGDVAAAAEQLASEVALAEPRMNLM